MTTHPTDPDKALPDVLKSVMDTQDVNAAELSRRSGVSMASLSRILSGQVNPSISNMWKISRALEVSLDTLMGEPPLHAVDGGAAAGTATHTPELTMSNGIAASYVLENTDKTPEEAAQLLTNAANGSWVHSWTDQYVDSSILSPKAIQSRQIGTKRLQVDMLFPHDMVESGSVVGLLSVASASITSTGAKLLDVRIPELLVRTFAGPAFGMRGLRDAMNKHGRPLLSATMRPMNGLSPKMYGRAIYEALQGGVDLTCDPTLLHSIPCNSWRERFRYASEAAHAATAETNEYKTHVANITAATLDNMIDRAEWAKDLDMGAVMVDSGAIGWAALQSLAKWCGSNEMLLCAMGGRALNGDMLSEQLQAKLLRFAGCDMASIGSPLRGNVGNRRFALGIVSSLRDQEASSSPEKGQQFDQPTRGLKATCPAVGGGHNPWHFPRLIDALGDDCLIQCGGSVMGHPWGSTAGAKANRVAVEALVQGRGEGLNLNVDGRTILQRAQRYSPELKAALDHWQEGSFLFGVVSGANIRSLEGQVITPDQTSSITSLHSVRHTPPEDES